MKDTKNIEESQVLSSTKEIDRLKNTIKSIEIIINSNMSYKKKVINIDITLFKLKEWYGE